MNIWTPTEALGVVVTAGIAAGTTFLAKFAADKSNAAATALTEIERQRQHRELTPRLRVTCEPWGNGIEGILRLSVTPVGPPGLDRIDKLTATIRNDHFRRGEGYPEHMGGPTAEQIKEHIWGPYHFTPSTGPDDARSNRTGRTTVYDTPVPLGEQLVYQLEYTLPGSWMTGMGQVEWIRQQGTLLRMAFTAEHSEYGEWYLPCEIETADLPVTVFLPQWTDSNVNG